MALDMIQFLYPQDIPKTFAELGDEIKINISHRAKAIRKLINYLEDS